MERPRPKVLVGLLLATSLGAAACADKVPTPPPDTREYGVTRSLPDGGTVDFNFAPLRNRVTATIKVGGQATAIITRMCVPTTSKQFELYPAPNAEDTYPTTIDQLRGSPHPSPDVAPYIAATEGLLAAACNDGKLEPSDV